MSSCHDGVSCDSCNCRNFRLRRYKCLVCYDYDLCGKCFDARRESNKHENTHPMQCMLTEDDNASIYHEEAQRHVSSMSLTCPICGQLGFTEPVFIQHVIREHTNLLSNAKLAVLCPICLCSGNTSGSSVDDLLKHLSQTHKVPRIPAGGANTASGGRTASVTNAQTRSPGKNQPANRKSLAPSAVAVSAASLARRFKIADFSQVGKNKVNGSGNGAATTRSGGNSSDQAGNSSRPHYFYPLGGSQLPRSTSGPNSGGNASIETLLGELSPSVVGDAFDAVSQQPLNNMLAGLLWARQTKADLSLQQKEFLLSRQQSMLSSTTRRQRDNSFPMNQHTRSEKRRQPVSASSGTTASHQPVVDERHEESETAGSQMPNTGETQIERTQSAVGDAAASIVEENETDIAIPLQTSDDKSTGLESVTQSKGNTKQNRISGAVVDQFDSNWLEFMHEMVWSSLQTDSSTIKPFLTAELECSRMPEFDTNSESSRHSLEEEDNLASNNALNRKFYEVYSTKPKKRDDTEQLFDQIDNLKLA